jgi:V-type H+-transporting ATPase subunit E
MAQQITTSNITNKSRLRILSARQEVLDSIFEDARKRLPEIQKGEKYGQLLKNLILEVIRGRRLMVGDVCIDGYGVVH